MVFNHLTFTFFFLYHAVDVSSSVFSFELLDVEEQRNQLDNILESFVCPNKEISEESQVLSFLAFLLVNVVAQLGCIKFHIYLQ